MDVSALLDRVCRACMADAESPTSLYAHAPSHPDFAHMLHLLTGLKVTENDGLPNNLCIQCVAKLDSAINFKSLCEKSDSLFRQYISGKVTDLNNSVTFIKEEITVENSFDVDNVELSEDYDNFFFKTEPEVQLNEDRSTSEKAVDETVSSKRTLHNCDICGKIYTEARSLKRHMSIHKGKGFKCTNCSKVFARRDHLKKHLMRVHTIKDIDSLMKSITMKTTIKYDCPHCGVDASNKVMMAKHLRACHKDKLPRRKNSAANYQDILEASVPSSNESGNDDKEDNKNDIILNENAESQTGNLETTNDVITEIKEEKPDSDGESHLILKVIYKCIICNTQYNDQHSYAAHMTKHSDSKSKGKTDLRCNICNKIFAKRKNLKQHILTHNEEKANKCTLCHRGFTRPDQLILHMNNHTGKKRHQCPHCDKGFNVLSTLKDHLRTHSGEKPYLCSICGKGFAQNTNLKQHLMRHSSTKPFNCTICNAKFVSKGELASHNRKHTGDHPYVCDICGAGLTTSSSLGKHKRTHSGERPYACDLCSLRFTALGTLKNHRRIHTGEKPFSCKYCTRAFAQKSDLVAHSRTHTGECPYVCSICGYQYQQSSALKAHIKNIHPIINKTSSNTDTIHHQSTIDGEKKLFVSFKINPEESQSSISTNK